MIKTEIIIKNDTMLHARPASVFVRESSKFKSKITLIKKDMHYNAKSILELLRMGISKEDRITIQIDGEDEALAFKEIVAMFNKFER
ncbi:MAG: HPr family phosphocarrier protein [Tissierellales bacterium]|nr:HPr family phosphocarrier protein [Tissierellales bacterium]